MIKAIKKGNKASYNGYLLGIHEYEDYMRLKEMIPTIHREIKTLRSKRI